MKNFILFFFVGLILTGAVDANAQARARKMCLGPDQSIRAMRSCPAGWTELSGSNLVFGQQVLSKFLDDGTEVLSSNVESVTYILSGFYRVKTRIADTNSCVINITQGLDLSGHINSGITFAAYTDPFDPSSILIESYDSTGVLKRAGVQLTANCL